MAERIASSHVPPQIPCTSCLLPLHPLSNVKCYKSAEISIFVGCDRVDGNNFKSLNTFIKGNNMPKVGKPGLKAGLQVTDQILGICPQTVWVGGKEEAM